MTPVPRIQDFYPSASSPPLPLVAVPCQPHTQLARQPRDVVTFLPSRIPLPLFPWSVRHFDSCNWPSAKLPTYGELALRFCGAAGRAVYQRCCNTITFCSVLRARAADSAQFYMQFRGGERSAERERERENAEVFNYIYPVEPVDGILTGNHFGRCKPLLSTLCAAPCLAVPGERGQMRDKNGTFLVNNYELLHCIRYGI